MKAPKRTPWASRSELEELYEMLFAPNADDTSRRRGLARMSIYISSPSCPTFIHLLHSLISVELLPYPPKSIEENQRSRMMIGMAIVRFINGLVDPLQNGPYARPISHLAATLSIPPSLISLRHRATHEDLPPLPLLHQSLLSCISYLHYYSFLPLISSSSSSNNIPSGIAEKLESDKRKIEGLTKKWKKITKSRLREKEVREEDQSAIELRKIKKLLQGFESGLIVDVLLSKGGIVPLAIEKRANFTSISPTIPSLKIWLPLLEHLQESSHPDFINQITSKILDILLNPESHVTDLNADAHDNEKVKEDIRTFRWELAVWLLHFWNTENNSTMTLQNDQKVDFIKRILRALLELHDDIVVRQLFKALQTFESSLKELGNLLPDINNQKEIEEVGLKGLEVDMEENLIDLRKMEVRLKQFDQILASRNSKIKTNQDNDRILHNTSSVHQLPQSDDNSPPGWRKLSDDIWKPCYIGCNGIIS
ncbi:uncharacterized protein I206_100274 [Kwoniella pini CBS 10737]|uniref:Las1-domain-containing protein n=1 Tax=Kwoniella pini CBS 10737 TaxID=1296096 RepID=A0A1B9IE94_9TREE|nr:uncharacterized protein I206_01051 [Kwoniella pini CBS 10737]OCF53744.1 hypothetical protein I206_01051 [Kwoniella pini CBS 10737]